jgi:hypothetical protein
MRTFYKIRPESKILPQSILEVSSEGPRDKSDVFQEFIFVCRH